MKKLFPFLVFALMAMPLIAQPHGGHGRPGAPRPARYNVSFESHHGESFLVYIDGDLVNRMPQSRVMVSDVSDRTHEVVVVLSRPAQKAAVLNLLPGEPSVVVNVTYDARTEALALYTASHNRAEGHEAPRPANPPAPNAPPMGGNVHNGGQTPPPPQGQPHAGQPEVRATSEADVDAMVVRMKGQSFDSDRLALGKVIVASANLTASQIARLAETIDFSSSQVEFLKYAYHYCIDKPNYYRTTDVLTFSSDKKKVLDYIATQR